jgi:hypothetical protein
VRTQACIDRSSSVTVHRANPNRSCESGATIRAKNWFWRAAMRREAGQHENFFIAKNRDSESAQRAFSRYRRLAMTSAARRSRNARITKTPAAQAFHVMLTIAGVGFSRTIVIVVRMVCRVVDQRASRALTSVRQHFLKQDAVFSNVLVYSGCSASRFPSARSD